MAGVSLGAVPRPWLPPKQLFNGETRQVGYVNPTSVGNCCQPDTIWSRARIKDLISKTIAGES